MKQKPTEVRSVYDLVAADYAAQFRDEMEKKPFDRKMLEWLVEKVSGRGVICDMGCGPGQVAGFLHSLGARVCGIDLSPDMIEQARELNPEIAFQVGDMLALGDVADASYAGIAAFYAIVNVPRASLHQALGELFRVLSKNGVLLLAFHIGREIKHLDEWWGKEVSIDFFFFETEEVKGYLQAAGFELQEVIERDPYTDVEYPSRRAYIFAKKP
jgi:ubiquinone/menaquinone biosynthesis C-methylase UbiE